MIARTNSRCSSNPPRAPLTCYPSPRAPRKTNRRHRLFLAGTAFACLCLSPPQAASQQIEYRSLPELIDAGSQALVRGDFPQAALAFNAIRENYAEEPVWQEGQLPAKILPLAGFASHKANLQGDAILALENYLAHYADSPDSEAFARYTLASSLMLDGQTDAARAAFAKLREIAGNSPFHDLASLREAQLSDPPRAIEILQNLIASPHSPRLATFARLRLIQLHLENAQLEQARIQLLDTPWPQTTMPELATLALLATQTADRLLADRPSDALHAYQLVPPKDQLLAAQQKRIEQLQLQYSELAPELRTEQSMWSDQFRQSITQLRQQLETLRLAPDYTPAINLRKARCFARINRPLEAWILLKPIATIPSDLAREAHLEWISTARSMQAWNAAARIAQSFLKKYPDDKDVPQILLWIALSQIERKDFAEAATSLQALVDKSPPPHIAAAAHYYLGFSLFNLANPPAAINAFQSCIQIAPNAPVAQQALLWIGICQFTTNELESAIATFQAIQQNENARFLHPEASFRETTCLYALGELEQSLLRSQSWTNTYQLHPRSAEAYLLQGDILLELNRAPEAIDAYALVETEDPQLAFLALSKRCELILLAGRPAEAAAILQTHRSQRPIPPDQIASFTQLLSQCLPPDGAQSEIQATVSRHGNDPGIPGIVALIHLLDAPPPASEEQTTLSSRLLVAEIQIHRQKGETTQAKLKALQLASSFQKTELPPVALLEAGKALTEIASLEAPSYFQRILETYPSAPELDSAHIGLARFYSQQDKPETALAHLLQRERRDTDTLALKLDLETRLGQSQNARRTAELILSDRNAKPAHKAQALQSLGGIAIQNKEADKAYAYYQRIFTLYRGETEYVANAYLNCIQILDSSNRKSDAQSVANEFLAQNDLQRLPAYQQAQTWIQNRVAPPPQPQ
ncbi:tetratricopeptide repeat protein [Pelagicoccus sp. SDUM812005]|uniref:tetratricopeptide repeat protein n=1 Tax=Pelagicoccus sp. SDUM812005 TaxID=3041257 RepID=UPI00280FE231|nr:tetratricopeptide repeat protein [Pelagicoccus sp. SDUM812005]MDQ8182785.1 tetratricopeptide repeat protein [Pelagicoccus sp. SDUM812005]